MFQGQIFPNIIQLFPVSNLEPVADWQSNNKAVKQMCYCHSHYQQEANLIKLRCECECSVQHHEDAGSLWRRRGILCHVVEKRDGRGDIQRITKLSVIHLS